jgi:hypothetical protein
MHAKISSKKHQPFTSNASLSKKSRTYGYLHKRFGLITSIQGVQCAMFKTVVLGQKAKKFGVVDLMFFML